MININSINSIKAMNVIEKEFTMSMFKSKEDLYKAKAEYYQDLVSRLKSCNTCAYLSHWEYCGTCTQELDNWEPRK